MNKIFDEEKDIILFGLGDDCDILIQLIEDELKYIDCIIDNDCTKWNSVSNGFAVNEPSQSLCEDKTIIITEKKANIVFKMIKQLIKMGVSENSIYYIDDLLHELIEKKISKVYDVLFDSTSKHVLKEYLKIRNSGSNDYSSITDYTMQQYDFQEQFVYKQDEVFIDGGAYDGTTIWGFAEKVNYKFRKIYSFEPDPNCYNIIYSKLQNDEKIFHRCKLIQKGLSNTNTTLKFISDDTGFGNINASAGNIEIRVTRLDDEVDDYVSFIKLDIEGHEINALVGAKKTITTYKPKLAICLYHRPEDVWTIPLYLKKLVPEYNFFIRHHTEKRNELVLYAVINKT